MDLRRRTAVGARGHGPGHGGARGPRYGSEAEGVPTAQGAQIGTDQDIAEALRATGNHDARILATLVADPEGTGGLLLDRWVADLDNYIVTDAFGEFAGRTRHAEAKMEEWRDSVGEWSTRAGWRILAGLAMRDLSRPDAFWEERLRIIEAEIHTRKNRVRNAMNGALIAIGIRNANLAKTAIAAAGRIGKVDVNHGETGCETPDAAAYIRRTLAHRARKGLSRTGAGAARSTSRDAGTHARRSRPSSRTS